MRVTIELSDKCAAWLATRCIELQCTQAQVLERLISEASGVDIPDLPKQALVPKKALAVEDMTIEERKDHFLEHLRKDFSPFKAAIEAGLDTRVVYQWGVDDPDFRARYHACQEAFIADVEADLLRLGRTGGQGNASALKSWLEGNCWRHGRLKLELINRIVGTYDTELSGALAKHLGRLADGEQIISDIQRDLSAIDEKIRMNLTW